jgi:glycosyltransferase involved in cell wall biosynthesis
MLVRRDFETKPGGDVAMAQTYARALTEAGATVSMLAMSRDRLVTAETVHLFNVDHRVEFGFAAGVLSRERRGPLVISPIHHPMHRVEHFEAEHRSGPLRMVNLLGQTAVGRERIKHALRRHSLEGLAEAARGGRSNRAKIAAALSSAELVIYLADGERRSIEATFGVSLAANGRLVPNSVDIDDSVDVHANRDIDVLVVGRIEERKNQLRIAEALSGTPWRVVFAGSAGQRSRRYWTAFLRTIDSAPNLEYHQHMPIQELNRLYGRARVLVSASHFEVVSLAELEAVSYGCQLVSTTSGYTSEYVGPHATYLEPTAPADTLIEAIGAARASGVNLEGMRLVRAKFDRASGARALVHAYTSAGLLPG